MDSVTYITRKQDSSALYADSEITLQEWMSFVVNDPEMRLDNHTTVTLVNGEDYRFPNPGAAVFLKRKSGQSLVQEVAFEFIAGSIRINNADQLSIQKIRHIAYKLNAQVFQETKKYTVQILLQHEMGLKPRFYFKDLFTPFKKWIPQLQHFAFSLFRHERQNSKVVSVSKEQTV
jgi:hypothetical protein